MPSRNPAAEVHYFTESLGARLVFAIEAMGARVAMLEVSEAPPRLLLADHLEGERPVLLYRVDELGEAIDALAARGWQPDSRFEIPYGPCASCRAEGGHRIAIYELTRAEVEERFAGRRDF